jgi:hypothetical protein
LKQHAHPDKTGFRHYHYKPKGPKGDSFTTMAYYGQGRAEALIGAGTDPLDSYAIAAVTQTHGLPRLTPHGDAIVTVGPLTGAEKAAVRTCVQRGPRFDMTYILRSAPEGSSPPPRSYDAFRNCLLRKGAALYGPFTLRVSKGFKVPGYKAILPGAQYAYLWKSTDAATADKIKKVLRTVDYIRNVMVTSNNKVVFATQKEKLNDKDLPVVIGCARPQHAKG